MLNLLKLSSIILIITYLNILSNLENQSKIKLSDYITYTNTKYLETSLFSSKDFSNKYELLYEKEVCLNVDNNNVKLREFKYQIGNKHYFIYLDKNPINSKIIGVKFDKRTYFFKFKKKIDFKFKGFLNTKEITLIGILKIDNKTYNLGLFNDKEYSTIQLIKYDFIY